MKIKSKITKTFSIDEKLWYEFKDLCNKNDQMASRVISNMIKTYTDDIKYSILVDYEEFNRRWDKMVERKNI